MRQERLKQKREERKKVLLFSFGKVILRRKLKTERNVYFLFWRTLWISGNSNRFASTSINSHTILTPNSEEIKQLVSKNVEKKEKKEEKRQTDGTRGKKTREKKGELKEKDKIEWKSTTQYFSNFWGFQFRFSSLFFWSSSPNYWKWNCFHFPESQRTDKRKEGGKDKRNRQRKKKEKLT